MSLWYNHIKTIQGLDIYQWHFARCHWWYKHLKTIQGLNIYRWYCARGHWCYKHLKTIQGLDIYRWHFARCHWWYKHLKTIQVLDIYQWHCARGHWWYKLLRTVQVLDWLRMFLSQSFSCTNTQTISSRLFFSLKPPMKMEQSVPKCRHIKFRRQEITQKKEYNGSKKDLEPRKISVKLP